MVGRWSVGGPLVVVRWLVGGQLVVVRWLVGGQPTTYRPLFYAAPCSILSARTPVLIKTLTKFQDHMSNLYRERVTTLN